MEYGYEIGSHAVTHQDLSATTPERIQKELAESQAQLETMMGGGYDIFTLSPPYGDYPDDEPLVYRRSGVVGLDQRTVGARARMFSHRINTREDQ